ncbi:MAG: competence/damage-inducible protein A [bacterium]|nr:competence/damage-inducible protein A [bacterium]
MSTAGIMIIGNEILSAKVEDENAPYLLKALRQQGVDVERVLVIADVVDTIAREVLAFSENYDYVLTSGGVGPTHDDVTMESIAKAFGTKLVIHERMEVLLRDALKGAEPNESQLKMCQMPEGSTLIESGDLWFPLVCMRNVYIFPGIPRLLQAKFESARDRFKGRQVFLRRVFVTCIESDIAQDLHDLLEDFPELMLGSYPRVTDTDYRTMLTLESRDKSYLTRAVDALVEKIPEGALLRVE